jgi:hypothetical protein
MAPWPERCCSSPRSSSPSCSPAARRPAAGAPTRLYVANARDGTVSQLDAASGRALGPPIPAGAAPAQVVASPAGSLLVVPAAVPEGGALAHVSRVGTSWVQRPVLLEPGASGVLVASDGGRRAAVAYHIPIPGQSLSDRRCRLALVDLDAGVVERRLSPCGAGEHAVSLALDTGPPKPVAYLGLVREAAGAAGPTGPTGPTAGRVVALDADGTLVAGRRMAGRPASLTLGPGPDRSGTRLYVAEGAADVEHEPGVPVRWRLLALDTWTLEVERAYPLDHEPLWPAVAPEGRYAYAVAGPTSLLTETVVGRLDLATGHWGRHATVPGHAMGLVAAAGRLYVGHPDGDEVWALDAARGRRLGATSVGRGLVGLAAGASGAAR